MRWRVAGRLQEMVPTVSPGNTRRGHRPPDRQTGNERTHDVLPKPDKLISYRHLPPSSTDPVNQQARIKIMGRRNFASGMKTCRALPVFFTERMFLVPRAG